MGNRNRSVLIAGVVAFVVLLAVAAACSGDGDEARAPSATNTPEGVTNINVGTVTEQDLYDKTELVAPANEAFTITYNNPESFAEHNIALYTSEQAYEDDEEAIAATAEKRGPVTQRLDVPALAPGEYLYICTVHPQTMFGTLRVE